MLLDDVISSQSVAACPSQSKELRVSCELLADALNDPGIRQSWLELHDRDPFAKLAQHPDGVATALRNEKGKFPGLLLIATVGDICVGLAILLPKRTTSRRAGSFGPNWWINGYRLAGTDVLGEPREAVRHLLLEEASRQLKHHGAGFLLLEDLEIDSPVWERVQALKSTGCGTFSPTGWQERLRISLPETGEEYWSKFSGKTRHGFRRKAKKLGETFVRKFWQLQDVAEFLDLAHQVSLNTWQSAQLGLRIQNNQAELEHFTFRAMHDAFRSYVLMQGGRPIAFLIGKQYRSNFVYEEVGYDREFSQHSPGQALLIEVLNDLFQCDRPDMFDFGGGEADYKRMFANQATRSANVWLIPQGFCPKATALWLKVCRDTRRGVRAILRKSGWLTRIRQALRRKVNPAPEQLTP